MTPEQLKASILQRAMEGKLVPQNPNDEPASELLKRIKAEKEKLISEGKIKRDKKETEIFRGDDGKHYGKFADGSIKEFKHNIPKGWAIVYLPDICALEDGSIKRGPFGSSITKSMFVPKGEHTYKVYEQGNAIRKTIDYGDYWLKESDYIRLKNFSIKAGDILISCAGTIGEIFQIPSNYYNGVINQALLKLTLNSDIIDSQYFKWMFTSLINTLKEHSIGSAIKNLASIKFLKYEVPMLLPPLSEQQRIVEAIESALERVDEYAKSYNRLEQLDKEFPDKLKKSILQYAMQGKLVEQDPNDESVEVLLEKIRAEKQKLFEEGKIKKKDLDISIVSQGDDNSYYLNNIKIEIDFPRRSTWLLAPLEKIVTTISAKPYQIKQSEIVKEGKIPVVSQSKILVEGFSNNFSKILDYKTNVVIFGDHTRNLKIIDFPFVVGADGVKILSPICLSAKFLKYHLDYTLLFVRNRGYARHYSYLKSKIIGIPSVLEQKRIVAKIDLLFQKVSQL
ncbi:restriction endonuclease subunit S [Streptococcus pseudopneumoniae]|uniref:restriction endonuclease subunit S n=6 Tax=Streptococcus TaxID=1301 RepID=UPI00287CDDF0|nr:restriction endonuclease subunit S [Streptococcus pseudopneumoniae]MDS9310416.1 restriction endonuclease subunit S [Streptococcus pseudopneumoniae]